MRKLASIQKIQSLMPIEGKDRIELALVQGWSVIVQKNEYKIGDLTIFVEPDSLLPEQPEFEFLRSKKFRIKTMKMGGVISQGICFPLSILPQGRYEEGDDVTEQLGVVKYNPYEEKEVSSSQKEKPWLYQKMVRYTWLRPLAKKLFPKVQGYRYGFPSFISKTDETRIQTAPFLLKDKEAKYIGREKIDGQSGTFFLKKEKGWFGRTKFDFGVCSRNLRLFIDDGGSQWSVAKKYELEIILKELIGLHEWVAIQGECIAPKVQGNKYGVKEADLYVFNLIYPNKIVECLEGEKILQRYGLKWAPLVVKEYTMPDTVKEILEYADGQSLLAPVLREGIVFRKYINGKKQSFKAVSPKFLLKYDE